MVHTVYLDDEYVNVKEILNEIHRQKQGVRFENPVSNNVTQTPEGYMTSAEFKKRAILKINSFCEKNGIL